MASNYPPGVTGAEPEIAGDPEIEEQFLVVLKDDLGGEYMELVNETRLGKLVDGSDYLPVQIRSVFVLREDQIVPVEFGDPELVNSMDDRAVVYGHVPVSVNGQVIAHLSLTDH